MIIVIAIHMYLLIYNMVITNIIYLFWLYLYIELYIILIKECGKIIIEGLSIE